MNAKLTLKLNKNVIEKAKKYAEKRNKSLSAFVEDYFNYLTEKNKKEEIKISPNVLELSGIIELPADFNLKQNYGKHLEEKYLKK